MTGARGSSCSQVVVANGVQLAGHVIVEDDAVIGGMCGVRQFVAIGRCLFPIRNDTSTASCAKELPACPTERRTRVVSRPMDNEH